MGADLWTKAGTWARVFFLGTLCASTTLGPSFEATAAAAPYVGPHRPAPITGHPDSGHPNSGHPNSGQPNSGQPSATVAGWPGNGELAVVAGGRLRLVDNSGGSYVVPGPGTPSQPSWSADGKWVAFVRALAVPAGQGTVSALWVARPDGTDVHRVSAPGTDLGQFAWGPGGNGENLAFSAAHPASSTSTLFLATGSRPPRRLATYSDLIGFSWRPSGGALAVSYRKGPQNQPGAGKGFVEITPVDGGTGRTVYTLADNGYVDLAGWWPDGKGLLFWNDPAGSASIAADGLTLDSFDLATLKLKPLAVTLAYSNWLAWSPNGDTLAIVAGGNRMIWDSGKHVELCPVPLATCHDVAFPAHDAMSLDPAWTVPGSLLFASAPGTKSSSAAFPPGLTTRGSNPYSAANVTAWYGAQHLFTATPTGSGARGLAVAGMGAHDPLATSGGLLYVQGNNLRYLPRGSGKPVNMASGLQSPSPYGNFYGYIAWFEDFAWHK